MADLDRTVKVRMRDLVLLTPMKCCVLIWQGHDGLWRWSNDWKDAPISEGFATRQLAVDDVMDYGSTRHWWPQILDVTPPDAAG